MYATRKLFRFGKAATVAAIALAIASTAGAQETRLSANPIPAMRSSGNPTVEDAQRLFDEGRWKDARRTYDEIVQRAMKDGEYNPKALEGRAQLQYITDDTRGAAKTFAQLAEQASKFGDPETELQAHFKAAILFQETRDYRNSALHVPRIKALLKSPVVAAATREAISKLIA
jgi:hypothetical protein